MTTMGKHIHSEYDEALESLRKDFADMFALVQDMFAGAKQALADSDIEAAEVARKTDRKVDALDKHICETIVDILRQWQPLASDLRFILACSRSVGHVERIGDYMKNVCKRLRRMLGDDTDLPDFTKERLLAMIERAEAMFSLTAQSFIGLVGENCDEILQMDNTLDELHKELFGSLRADISAGKGDVEVALESMLVSKNLERIGDHITNVAEMIAFAASAEIYNGRQVVE